MVGGLVGDPVDTSKVEMYVRQCQSLMVDASMANAAGTIDAVGYVDMQPNANESNDGYVQDQGSSNRIAWRSVNGVTTPATLRELNIKNSGPQYVGAVTDPVLTFNESEPMEYTYPGSPLYPMTMVPPEFYAVGTDVDPEKFHNIPWDPEDVVFGMVNYNSRLASHLWVKMFKNGVEILNSRVTGSPSASTTDCLYIQYDFVGTGQENVVCNITWRMYNGSYTVDFLQQFISFILGITTYPMWYGTDAEDSFMLHLPSIPYDSHQTTGYSFLVNSLAGMIMSNGIVQGVVWNRIKGFFKKASSFIANKLWPVIRPLANAAASVLPGPANLVLTRVVSGVDTVVTNVNSIAVSNGDKALITEDGQELGDKFEVTMQTHICELDENDEPIALDTVTSDDYLWQDSGEVVDVYVNSASQGQAVQSFMSFSNRGKFIERVAAFRAADKPVYVQNRLKVVFHKEAVQAGFKAAFVVGGDVAYE